MKILIVFSSSELGGAERSLTRMVSASLVYTPSITYYVGSLSGEGAWSRWAREQGLEPISFGGESKKHAKFDLTSVLRMLIFAKRTAIEGIYVIGFRASVWCRLLSWLFPSVKVIQGVRWNPSSRSLLDRVFRLVEQNFHRWTDGYITNSHAAAQALSRCSVPLEKIAVIHNGLSSIPYEVTAPSTRPLQVIIVANLNPRKGHEAFLDVIALVIQRLPRAKFVFVGRDDMDGYIQRRVEERGLSSSVDVLGFRSDIEALLCESRLMVLPSLHSEGCPTSILEGMSCGVPVVAYSVDGIPELIDQGKDGILIDSQSPASVMAEAIIGCLASDDRLDDMAVHAREKVRKYFTLERCCITHCEVFERMTCVKSI